MENFLCKRLHLIIPAFRWATNSSTRFYTIVLLPPLVGIPFTCNRGPRIHSRCNLRCKTKSPNQQSLNPWSNIENLLCIFQFSVFCFFFPRAFLTARRSKGRGLFYWAASRRRLFLYWPVSRCACGREGICPDLPLPGWEATARHSWAGEGEEVAEGWKVSVEIVVRGEILKQQAGSEGGGCCMGKEG